MPHWGPDSPWRAKSVWSIIQTIHAPSQHLADIDKGLSWTNTSLYGLCTLSYLILKATLWSRITISQVLIWSENIKILPRDLPKSYNWIKGEETRTRLINKIWAFNYVAICTNCELRSPGAWNLSSFVHHWAFPFFSFFWYNWHRTLYKFKVYKMLTQ